LHQSGTWLVLAIDDQQQQQLSWISPPRPGPPGSIPAGEATQGMLQGMFRQM